LRSGGKRRSQKMDGGAGECSDSQPDRYFYGFICRDKLHEHNIYYIYVMHILYFAP